MTSLTIRMDDDKHKRLKVLAKSRGVSLNRLIDDMTTMLLTELDIETRFKASAALGKGKEQRGLELLAKASGGRFKY